MEQPMRKFTYFLPFLIFISSVALGDRAQNDNIDMQGNAIKNADIQGGTASNTSRITIPKAATATLDALTRKEGTVWFDSTTKKFKGDNGTLLSELGSGGSGGTGLNAVTNSTGATDTTGYSDSDSGSDVTRTDTAAELPLYPAVTTGLKIDPDASTEYIAYCGTMPEALQNRKLRFSQWQKAESGYDSGDLKLEIYPSTSSTCASVGTKYALNKDSSGTTSIPSATQDFWVTFDADGSDYFQIRWVRTNSSTEYLVVQNVFIGAGDQPTGPPQYDNQTVTMTSSWVSNTTVTAKETRRGSWAYYDVLLSLSGAPTSATLTLTLPTGRTIDTSALAGGTDQNNITFGTVSVEDTGTQDYFGRVAYQSTTQVIPYIENVGSTYPTPAVINATAPVTFASGDKIYMRFSVPIAEWADSANVVNYGQQDVEFLYNSGTWDADDTTSFAYGSGGGTIGGSLTTNRSKRVRAQSPIQSGDLLQLEFSDDGVVWFPVGSARISGAVVTNSIDAAGSTVSGAYMAVVNSTDIDILFGRYQSMANDDAPATNWTSGDRYRVKKISGNALGGFQYATAAQNGLEFKKTPQTSLTVTCPQAGYATQRAVGVAYSDINGVWRLRFNIVGTFTSATVTGVTLTISGITAKNTTNFYQSVNGFWLGASTNSIMGYVSPNASTIIVSSSSASTITGISVSGDVELESKPTWAI
jgi:hypothetical protein